MNGVNETGGAATPPEVTRPDKVGCVGRYHAPSDPHKPIRFVCDGQPLSSKGKRAALLRALIAAGSEGVAHIEVMPWLLNASDAANALRKQGLVISLRKGRPNRWMLRSHVREVQP